MAIVKNLNGTEPGTDGDMVKYNFNGSPNSLFEHVPVVGEYRVMTVTVECTQSGHKKNRDGSYSVATFAIREATLGRETEAPPKPEKKRKGKSADDPDPNQVTVDEAITESAAEAEGEAAASESDAAAEAAESNNYDPFAAQS